MYKEKENTKVSLCLAALLLEKFPIKLYKFLCLAGRSLRKTFYLFADIPDSAWNVLSFAKLSDREACSGLQAPVAVPRLSQRVLYLRLCHIQQAVSVWGPGPPPCCWGNYLPGLN